MSTETLPDAAPRPTAHPEFLWFNGGLVPWASATVHVMTHATWCGRTA
jgi:hypothetical protein